MFGKTYKNALLRATYKRPGERTDAHEKAENHPYKTKYLFKKQAIPKDLYTARVIQQFLIIQSIERRLKNLSKDEKAEINAFFTFSYLDSLWRTSSMEADLKQLDVNPHVILPCAIAKRTRIYLADIEGLSPKMLLGHFLMHVAGFMHGGNIIQSKYINPSNKISTYKIPAQQYSFSSSPLMLYGEMMREMDKITLSDREYEELLEQCTNIYTAMTGVYDDLCEMHIHFTSLPALLFSLVTFLVILKLLMDSLKSETTLILPSSSFGL